MTRLLIAKKPRKDFIKNDEPFALDFLKNLEEMFLDTTCVVIAETSSIYQALTCVLPGSVWLINPFVRYYI